MLAIIERSIVIMGASVSLGPIGPTVGLRFRRRGLVLF